MPVDSHYAWYSEAELDQLLAPVALYPDSVLSNILIASTYPLEIVEADRWLRNNPGMDADTALQAARNQPWDDSVKALVAFPQLVARLSEDLNWTQQLGDAFLVAEADVMDRVQVLRMDARRAGQLRSTEQVQVIVERETIIIEPVVERVVYLPYYDTRVVYGSWRWHSHPPVYWRPLHPPGRTVVHSSIYWGPPVYVRPLFVSAPVWTSRQVVVVNQFNFSSSSLYYRSSSIRRHPSAVRWTHHPQHRRGVAYHPRYQPRQVVPARSHRPAARPAPPRRESSQLPRYANTLVPPRQQSTRRQSPGQQNPVQGRQQRERQFAASPQRQSNAQRNTQRAEQQRSHSSAIASPRREAAAPTRQRSGSNTPSARTTPERTPGWAPSPPQRSERQVAANPQRQGNAQRNEQRARQQSAAPARQGTTRQGTARREASSGQRQAGSSATPRYWQGNPQSQGRRSENRQRDGDRRSRQQPR